MPFILSDPPMAVYAVLVLLAVVSLGLYFRKRSRPFAIFVVAIVVLLIAVTLIDKFVESPREEAVRRSKAIVEALNEQNWEKMAPHISDTFEYDQMGIKVTKAHMKGYVELSKMFSMIDFKSKPTTIWGFNNDVRYNDAARTVEIEFDFKASEIHMWHFKARYVKDPDGQFRLKDFLPYKFGQNTPDNLPLLPR